MSFPFRTDKDLTNAGWLTPTEAACAQAFNDIVRKERDYERVRSQRLERELAAARAENGRLRESAERLLERFPDNASGTWLWCEAEVHGLRAAINSKETPL